MLALDRNREALLRIVAALVAMMPGDGITVLPRSLRLAILSVLRPAESALRRLIVVAARGMVAPPEGARRLAPAEPVPRGTRKGVPSFSLFDRRRRVGPFVKRVPGPGPGVRGFDGMSPFAPVPEEPRPDDPVDAERLRRRLTSVLQALDDLPKQARRLVRVLAGGRAKYTRPMRPGRPPGHVSLGRREVDAVLAECQRLALMALQPSGP